MTEPNTSVADVAGCDVPAAAVVVCGVERRYAGGSGVGPVDLQVPAGSVTGLVGANGAGKTTLLRLVTGLLAPQRGTVTVWGQPVLAGRPPVGLGAMIEEPAFYRWATGEQNLLLAAGGRPAWERRVDAVLDLVGLSDVARRRVAGYSQGMRQRLGLARALLGEPRLLVLDEPTNGLDPQGIRWLRNVVRGLAREGVTTIVSSHLLGEMELMADHVVVLVGGEVVAALDPSGLGGRPGALEDAYLRLMGI